MRGDGVSELADGLATWITYVMDALGYRGVGFLIFLENIIPPIPSELILPLAGFLVSEGRFSFAAVVLAATVGSVLSSMVWWTVGRLFGERRVSYLVERFGRWVFLSPSDVRKAQSFFDSHGGKAVFFGRFVPGVRSLVSVPAGLAKMRLLPFVVFTALGSGLWNGFLVTLGMLLRERWREVLGYLDAFEYVVYAGIFALVATFVFARGRSRFQQRNRA